MNRLLPLAILLFIFGMCFTHADVFATHLRAGEITVERLNCASLRFKITITVYIDTEEGVRFGGPGELLYFGDGEFVEVPETPTTPRPDLGPFMGMVVYTTEHTYRSPGSYKLVYVEPNRNRNVLNIPNSVNTTFSISTFLNIEPSSGCNANTPKLSVPPIDRACSGVAFFHNAGAYDSDGDSISYELTTPAMNQHHLVAGYSDPDDPQFYTNYNNANEEETGPPNFTIDPVKGTITWNAPGMQGEYNIAFRINEWRKNLITGAWELLSYVTRDMQIIVEDCDNERPDLMVPQDTCVEAGTVLTAEVLGIDPDNDQVKIEAFSEIFMFPGNQHPAFYVPFPAEFQPSEPPAKLSFQWNTDCIHIKNQPYQVVFKITDKPDNGPPLVTFKTWNIKVVGPAPEWQDASLDLAKQQAALEWENYVCNNASAMQVWRRVGPSPFMPGYCETGMPDFLGYELIDVVPAMQSQYTDTNGGNGLAPGAMYCYRLVAVFPDPRGGESYVSKEICIGPVPADAPVITHVTVMNTDMVDGAIRVSWRSPFDIGDQQFAKPYRYEVYRADGFAGSDNLLNVSGIIQDTTFLDVGMNTQEKIYNYRVVLYATTLSDANYQPVDTSAVASSIRLDAVPLSGEVELKWDALVPWSNQVPQFPWHYIYRGDEGMRDEELTLIDSVQVIQSGFNYMDRGDYQGIPLDKDKIYCYRVMTSGSYGNPSINEPLKNFSQTICIYPDDTRVPCKPQVSVKLVNCEEFFQTAACGVRNFSNTIYWSRPAGEDCRTDIRGYNIYTAKEPGGVFTLQAVNVVDTFFVDTNLSSFAKCYRVAAVDYSGNESELSDPVCNDNCPYYELPNVFTPNEDGCNDRFTPYYDHGNVGEEEGGCVVVDKTRCPRFVKDVSFRVFNRWGKEVYTYRSGSERTIYIEWDGKDNSGNDLSSAVYYYVAEVTFDAVDPAKRKQTLKGWVHLLR